MLSTRTLYQVEIAIDGDRSWCLKQQAAVRERLRSSTFALDCLPSVTVDGEPARLVLRWIDLDFASGSDALSVAEVAAESLLPGYHQLPFVSLRWAAQDPDADRRRPPG